MYCQRRVDIAHVTCGSEELFSSSFDHGVPDTVLGTSAM